MEQVIFASLVSLQTGASPSASGGNAPLDPWELILHASLAVKLVIITLTVMGLVCLFIMGAKFVRLSQAAARSRRFLATFWEGEENGWSTERLETIYARLRSFDGSPLAAVFKAGYVELARVMGAGGQSDDLDSVERALQRSATVELTTMEMMLPFLATTGATAPFIGLFGTVWGIMDSFLNIGAQASASLDVVAPGIAEALIATAIGLVAAIPAVMAYNFFVRRIRVLESELETFSKDYLNIVRRHFLR